MLTFTGRRPEREHWFVNDPTMSTAIEFCRRHGEDPHRVMNIDLIDDVHHDTPHIRFTLKLLDEDGNAYLACRDYCNHRAPTPHGGDCVLATETRERELVGDLPEWWQPAISTIRTTDTED
jgi:hypothetical protein